MMASNVKTSCQVPNRPPPAAVPLLAPLSYIPLIKRVVRLGMGGTPRLPVDGRGALTLETAVAPRIVRNRSLGGA
jgi:hypothetical protein